MKHAARLGALTLGIALLAGVAQAAPPLARERELSDGVDRTQHDLSGQGDASSLDLNPALLNATPGLDITARGYQAVNGFARGSGFGAFISANLGRGFALALGFQNLRPAFDSDTLDYDSEHNRTMSKIGFGIAGGDPGGRLVSFGLGLHGVRRQGAWLRSPDLDFGLAARMTRFASLGATIHTGPTDLDSSRFRATFDVAAELAIRPFGTRRVELAGALVARTDQTDDASFSNFTADRLYPRGRLQLAYHGLSVHAEVEQVGVTSLDASTLEPIESQKALRGSVGIGVAWDYLGAEVGVHAGVGDGIDGVGYAARFSSVRQGRVWPLRPVDVERFAFGEIDGQRELVAVLERLDRSTRDGRRSVVMVETDGLELGWAAAEELRSALVRLRNAGGHVYAWMESPDLASYYVASAAERVLAHPAAEFELYGLSASRLYFKDALAKIGIRVQALHFAEYKSAHEGFSRSDRSTEDREQRKALLEDTWDVVSTGIAQGRGLTLAQVDDLLRATPIGADEAGERGLVDDVVFRDERAKTISDHLGSPVSVRNFSPIASEQRVWDEERYIGVLLVEGTIAEGKSRHLPILNIRTAGADTGIELIAQMRNDPRCEGIVVRVDSPGGSAMASETLWREISLTADAHDKDPTRSPPIVVSMSNVAASGGYYIASDANAILASPLTVTGSIGVVAMHWDVSGLLTKLGINADTIAHGELASAKSMYEPWTASQIERLQGSMQRTYDRFLKRVSAGRSLKREAVDKVARGRVWSGQAAIDRGLVDRAGGLHEAIQELRRRGGVRPRDVLALRVVPEKRTLLQFLLGAAGSLLAEPVGRLEARRSAKRPLPLALDRALARLPLSILDLPQSRASLLAEGLVRVD